MAKAVAPAMVTRLNERKSTLRIDASARFFNGLASECLSNFHSARNGRKHQQMLSKSRYGGGRRFSDDSSVSRYDSRRVSRRARQRAALMLKTTSKQVGFWEDSCVHRCHWSCSCSWGSVPPV